jgi:hypothetical protein
MTSYGSIEFEADDRRPQITVAEGSGGGGVPMPISQRFYFWLIRKEKN